MDGFRVTIQTDARFIPHPFPGVQGSTAIAGGLLVLFFLFVLFASLLKHNTQTEEEQIETHRRLLERIWNANSNLER